MNADDIELEDLSKSFEYKKACIEIDMIENLDDLKNIAKSYFKLYLKQQEVIKNLVNIN